jgi:hypothetical protein
MADSLKQYRTDDAESGWHEAKADDSESRFTNPQHFTRSVE